MLEKEERRKRIKEKVNEIEREILKVYESKICVEDNQESPLSAIDFDTDLDNSNIYRGMLRCMFDKEKKRMII